MGLLNKLKAVAGAGSLVSAYYTFQGHMPYIDNYIPNGSIMGIDYKSVAYVALAGLEVVVGLELLWDL